jgi:2-isopropylmalate synthase
MTANKKDNVIIFDTTLRDGEQSPGATMNLEEKILIAKALDAMGVDVIEAGFAMASDGDLKAIQEVAKILKNAKICSLARARKADIERAAEAVKPAEKKRIHTFIATSPLHMEYKLQMSPEAVHQAVIDSVTFARQLVDDVEWSAEDATRTDPDFLCRVVEAAIKAGARTVNIPDTVGYTTPEEYFERIAMLKNRVPNIDQAVISVHCHNDLGLAVANSLAAVKAGARQIECTINGLGERAGNAALEEIVMALRVRQDVMPYVTNIQTSHIARISRLVSTVTGFVVQKNKAIVGANAFAHESGIHQDGMLKNRQTYEIISPEMVGIQKSDLVLGKHSGRHALVKKLESLGVSLADGSLDTVFSRFKALADKKKEVYDDDILTLLDAEHGINSAPILSFISLAIQCGSDGPAQAALSLNVRGTPQSVSAYGDGPVDATFNAIKDLVPHEAKLEIYQVHAVTRGTDAQAEVTVRLQQGERSSTGNGRDTDTLVASAKSYISALNKLLDSKLDSGL